MEFEILIVFWILSAVAGIAAARYSMAELSASIVVGLGIGALGAIAYFLGVISLSVYQPSVIDQPNVVDFFTQGNKWHSAVILFLTCGFVGSLIGHFMARRARQ